LHLGSLLAAVGSYLHARASGGSWLVRIEDIDPPREQEGASADILATLDAYGLHWDEPVLYQSSRLDAYREAVRGLIGRGDAYRCTCTRSMIAAANADSHTPAGRYPGTCRTRNIRASAKHAVRVRVQGPAQAFDDLLQGHQVMDLGQVSGDFVIHRRDGLPAYQLAVVVDDAAQGITHVVRGIDLLDSTHRQVHLQQALGLPTPAYLHLPVIVNRDGQKLSKQTGARAVSRKQPSAVLCRVLRHLGLDPPAGLETETPTAMLQWASARWQPAVLSGLQQIWKPDP
jgi:glutamyl-Q tRNA(Asp) synthetase